MQTRWDASRQIEKFSDGWFRALERSLHPGAPQLWEPVALWMHEQYPGGTAPRKEILQQLAGTLVGQGIARDAGIRTAESYLDTAARWAGILIERGPNVFGFVHQTFQEYLAARALDRKAEQCLTEAATCPGVQEVLVSLLAGKEPEVRSRAAAVLRLLRPLSEAALTGLVERLRDKDRCSASPLAFLLVLSDELHEFDRPCARTLARSAPSPESVTRFEPGEVCGVSLTSRPREPRLLKIEFRCHPGVVEVRGEPKPAWAAEKQRTITEKLDFRDLFDECCVSAV